MLRRRKRISLFVIVGLFVLILFVIPLVISISYGNIPFISTNYLYSYNVLVVNDQQSANKQETLLNYNTYTWDEIKRYVINSEMNFTHVFRDTLILLLIAFIAICLDRLLLRSHFKKK